MSLRNFTGRLENIRKEYIDVSKGKKTKDTAKVNFLLQQKTKADLCHSSDVSTPDIITCTA